MALNIPGTILSQFASPIHPSQGWAPMMVSIWSVTSSRLAREYFMPKWPMAMPSQTTPPTLQYQTLNPRRFSSSSMMRPSLSRWAWPGMCVE